MKIYKWNIPCIYIGKFSRESDFCDVWMLEISQMDVRKKEEIQEKRNNKQKYGVKRKQPSTWVFKFKKTYKRLKVEYNKQR